MISRELQEFIDSFDTKLNEKYGCNLNEDKMVLLQMMKVNEEIGELCNEILASYGCQRDDKLNKHNKESLEGEAVDVLFAVFILLKKMNIDINKIIGKNMQKIKERFEIE